jgi:hypothetical protein
MRAAFELLRRDSDRLFGSRSIQLLPVSVQARESSDVSRVQVTTPTGRQFVFVKTLKPRGTDERGVAEATARLRKDFEVARHVFDSMQSTPDLRAVEPLLKDEQLLCVVTREAAGVPLDVATSKRARWPISVAALHDLETAFERVGRWIATFQRVAPDGGPSHFTLDEVREYIDIRLQRLVAIPQARFGEGDRSTVLAHFDRCAADVPARDLFTVPSHGDITPSNVLVASDTVTVIDFAMAARASKYLDLARIYTQLEFYTAKPQYRPHVIALLQRAALDGFEPGLDPDNPLFEIGVVQHVVCHFLSHARQPGAFPASLYSRHQCRRHRHWLRRLAVGAERRAARPREVAGQLL